MANKYAVATGNWSSTSTWNNGTLPQSSDDVYANNYSVTIDSNRTAASIRTTSASGIAEGGGFFMNDSFTMTANVIAGKTTCLNFTGGAGKTGTIVGNVTGGNYTTQHGAISTSTGTLNVTGNVAGGSANLAAGIMNQSTGTINITGSVAGGSGNATYGINNPSTGTVNITGNVAGGSGTIANGVNNGSTGTVNITGNVSGGNGPNAYGANNGSTGTINIAGSIAYGIAGTMPSTGKTFINPAAGNTVTIVKSDLSTVTFHLASDVGDPPEESNVREGITYHFAEKTGTLQVPASSNVASGVPVDHTTGTAMLTPSEVWNAELEQNFTFKEALRIALAVLAGKVSGASGTTITIRNPSDTKSRVIATIDQYGNRTALTYDTGD